MTPQQIDAAADALVSNGCALSVLNGALVATDSGSSEALRAMFIESASPPSRPATPNLTRALPLPRNDGRQPLLLLASPVPHSHRCRSGADLLLLVTDPERSSAFPDSVLHSLYGLTSAETEVANGLLMGYSLGRLPASAG